MSDDKRDAAEVLIGVIRAPNSNYSPGVDAAKLDAAEALHVNALIVKPGTDEPIEHGPASAREKLYTEVIEAVREISRRGNEQRTRVRACALLLKWGES